VGVPFFILTAKQMSDKCECRLEFLSILKSTQRYNSITYDRDKIKRKMIQKSVFRWGVGFAESCFYRKILRIDRIGFSGYDAEE